MSKRLGLGLLIAFGIVDVVLVVGAVRHVNGTPPSSNLPAEAAPAGVPTPSPVGATTTETTSAPAQVRYAFRASSAVALASANDGTIVYGTRGRCTAGKDAEVSVSTNGGEDFAPVKTGLTTTLTVRTTGAASITVVGTDDECRAQQLTSTDGGRTWDEVKEIDLWYPSADSTRNVVTPAGTSSVGAGCVVTSVSQVTPESGRVSCANGTVRGSGDNGKTWVTLGRLDNVRVATFSTPSKGYALARYNGCGANQFSTTDGGVTWTPGGCIAGDPAQAISATVNGLAAVVADQPYVSTDDGKSWMQP
ncbi:hypothetical protein GEV29_03375 [Aeromicrobium sp. SMF47]|uniref:WD40/YVTN/BNR-like repeat-containing protein n=1 Tax=Aeromicrobium yanjiei TaxID=2662028 RepID=UPI00129DF202|nr:sialidase family protein [Aeromicrobium yanjiei]MRJ75567.1 hypothetical protein [Aeromicrobium yanjiei]